MLVSISIIKEFIIKETNKIHNLKNLNYKNQGNSLIFCKDFLSLLCTKLIYIVDDRDELQKYIRIDQMEKIAQEVKIIPLAL